ncbi:DUF1028 domain-containing protein [Chengkuizengella axinellae]|uniref:DUF1028 domain-containing protein n=1 Tax=Chengkuizengella axinellae TaxID=3064388 RepID=A0ABT9J038_9BACL|nr:DUF1028 domain-containing protein [Chengkuizengella sp. 2205SS18-9]MDP5274380.1 DUF1028 domain-containing protein [Chengkuizengella sp. 2205SS18-9]
MKNKDQIVATFSIVGFDPKTKELGIAVQSKFLGVGAVVPWAKAGVGAIATQSFANTSYGPKGLDLMASGKSAQETLDLLVSDDEERGSRQAGIVDANGNAATFTGDDCYDWAGGFAGPNVAVQGNILVNEKTVEMMVETFNNSEGELSERLLTALDAGQNAGGDSRGKQSAALLVVKEKGGYAGFNDRYIDLRVDDHPEPIKELIRLHKLQQLYFSKTKANHILEIKGKIKEELTSLLSKLNYLSSKEVSDVQLNQAFKTFIHTENFEERDLGNGKIDKEVLEFMKSKVGQLKN